MGPPISMMGPPSYSKLSPKDPQTFNLVLNPAISVNISFGCSKELSHQDRYFEYPQHMICREIRIQRLEYSTRKTHVAFKFWRPLNLMFVLITLKLTTCLENPLKYSKALKISIIIFTPVVRVLFFTIQSSGSHAYVGG